MLMSREDPTAACCINGDFIELVTVRPLEVHEGYASEPKLTVEYVVS